MSFSWRPIGESFGAAVLDFDTEWRFDEADGKALRALWRERGLLIFRGRPMAPAQQVALTALFGEPEIHPAREAWVEGRPELTNIRYLPDQRERTLIYDVGGTELANWQPWHIDTIYTEKVDRGGMLYAAEVPPSGADTGFIDRAALYDEIPNTLRRRTEGRRVLYRLNPCANRNPFFPDQTVHLVNKPAHIQALEARIANDFPVVSHPVFFVHPESGRSTFNVTAMHAIGMEDMDKDQGDALLRELVAFSLAAARPYYHRWKTDDVVLWDNWRFLHSAEGTPVTARRRLRRSGIVGDYGLGRVANRGQSTDLRTPVEAGSGIAPSNSFDVKSLLPIGIRA